MALPTTITGISTAVACVGPFISSGGNVYFIGKDSGAEQLQAQKASDPTSSFSAVGTDVDATNAIQRIAAFQVGDVIHVATADGNTTSVAINYYQFDMSSDSWSVTFEQAVAAMNPSTSGGAAAYGVSLVVRSGGEAVILYNGPRVANMGNSYSQIYYIRRTGTNTYSSSTQVSAGGQIDFTIPEAILGTSDRVHFIFCQSAITNVQRALSSGNSLQTQGTASNGVGEYSAISYDNGGTIKVVSSSAQDNTIGLKFDSADNPTEANGDTSVMTNGNTPMRLFFDGTDVWVLARNSSDSDLYAAKSTDNGASFAAASSAMTATVGAAATNLSVDGSIFTRSGNVVIPYVVNDNGTLKYNEYVVRSVATTSSATFPGSSALSATGKLVLGAAATFPGSSTLSANAKLTLAAAATFSGASTLSATGQLAEIALARLSGESSLSADATIPIATSSAQFSGASSLSALAQLVLAAQASFSGASTLSAAASLAELAQATFAGASTLSASAQLVETASAVFSGASTLSANAQIPHPAFATFSGASTLTATAQLALPANATFAGASTLTASAVLQEIALATLSGGSGLSAAAQLTLIAAITLPGSSTLSADATIPTSNSQATLAGDGSLSASAQLVLAASATFSGESSLSADATLVSQVVLSYATLQGEGTLSADAIMAMLFEATLMAGSSLYADASLVTTAVTSAVDVSALGDGVARGGDEELTEAELQWMFRKIAELKKAKSDAEKERLAKQLEVALAQAAQDEEAAEVIAATIEEARPVAAQRRDYSGVMRDAAVLSEIVRNLRDLLREHEALAADEDDAEVLLLA